jgi:hypothetical protein
MSECLHSAIFPLRLVLGLSYHFFLSVLRTGAADFGPQFFDLAPAKFAAPVTRNHFSHSKSLFEFIAHVVLRVLVAW